MFRGITRNRMDEDQDESRESGYEVQDFDLADFTELLETGGLTHTSYYHYTNWDAFSKMMAKVEEPGPAQGLRMLLLTRASQTNDKIECGWGDNVYMACFSYSRYEDVAMWVNYGKKYKHDAIRIRFNGDTVSAWFERHRQGEGFFRAVKDGNGFRYERLLRSDVESVKLVDVAYVLPSWIMNGRQRDQYVKQRFFMRGEKSAKAAVEEFKKKNAELEDELKAKQEALEKALAAGEAANGGAVIDVIGKQFNVARETALPLDAKFLEAIDKPAGLVYKIDDPKGKRFIPAETWSGFYEALLDICADIDPAEFEKLPDIEAFKPKRKGAKPNFVRRNDRTRLKAATGYIGPHSDIRANLMGISKSSFFDPKRLPCRLMAYFGIAPADVRVWTGK